MRLPMVGGDGQLRPGAVPHPPDSAKVGVSWVARAYYAVFWLPLMAFLGGAGVIALQDALDPPAGTTAARQWIVFAEWVVLVGTPGWLIWRLSTRSATVTRGRLVVRGMWRTRKLDWSAVHDLGSSDTYWFGKGVALGNARAVFEAGRRIRTVTVSTSFRRGHAAALRLRSFSPRSHPSRRSCSELFAWQTPETATLADADVRAVAAGPVLAVYRPDRALVVITELVTASLMAVGVAPLAWGVIASLDRPVVAALLCLAVLAAIAATAVLMVGIALHRVIVTPEGLVVRERTGRTTVLPWTWVGTLDVLRSGLGAVVCVRRADAVVVELAATAAWQRRRASEVRDELEAWRARCGPVSHAAS